MFNSKKMLKNIIFRYMGFNI